jgi:hypothetical protein
VIPLGSSATQSMRIENPSKVFTPLYIYLKVAKICFVIVKGYCETSVKDFVFGEWTGNR